MTVRLRVSVGRAALAATTVGLVAAPMGMAQTPPVTTPGTPTAPTAPTAPKPVLPKGIIAPGVTIAGIDVSGQTARQARATVTAAYAGKLAPMVLVARGSRITFSPRTSGYTVDIPRAVKAAMNVGRSQPAGPADIPVTERINRERMAAVIRYRTKARNVPARDAVTSVRGKRLITRPSRTGIAINVDRSVDLLTARLKNRKTSTLTLPLMAVRPAVAVPPTAILVDRANRRLTVIRNGKRTVFPVAVGQPAYPTPFGNFHVTDMQRNPTWYPPDSRWAAGLGPVPPGSGNPLGTRWMGTSSPGIGMHGTPSSYSIGTAASHGCIRMYIRDAERLYDMISVGTPVYIR